MTAFNIPALSTTLAAEGLSQVLSQILVRPRSIGPFTADVTIEEIHRDRLEVTEHPVERGGVIADHAFKRPAELTIRCGFSDSSFAASGLGGMIGGALGGVVGQAVGGAVGNTTLGIAGSFAGNIVQKIAGGASLGEIISGGIGSYVDGVYSKFVALQKSRELFTIVTGKRIYNNMLITTLQTPTDYKSENSLFLTLECREMLLASTSTAIVGDSSKMASPASNAPVSSGWTQSLQPGPSYNPNWGTPTQ